MSVRLRRYGRPPYRVILLHGGPGAPGTMAPVARQLGRRRGVLEPLQAEASLEGQLGELRELLERHAQPPAALVGSSWGAMLGYIFAARYPSLVRKLVLVGSGVFEERYAASIWPGRLSRLTPAERSQAQSLRAAWEDPTRPDRQAAMGRLDRVLTRADTYDPLTLDTGVTEVQPKVHRGVWAEARALRASGQLAELGRQIRCPVLAIHGDHDPHPAQGVREPLARVLADFRFVLLEQCGHLPWIERRARRAFFALLEAELD